MKFLLIVCGPTGSAKDMFSWRYPVQFMCNNHSEVKLQEDSFAVETTLEADSKEVNLLATKGVAEGFTVQVVQSKFVPKQQILINDKELDSLKFRSVFEKIIENAVTFRVPLAEVPTNHGIERIAQFHEVLTEEVDELLDDVSIVNVADTLADIIVYCLNEGARWGIPMEPVLHLVIDSQRSKLLPNGEPLWAPDGSKYLKGPNFIRPEPGIARLLADIGMFAQQQGRAVRPMETIVEKAIGGE